MKYLVITNTTFIKSPVEQQAKDLNYNNESKFLLLNWTSLRHRVNCLVSRWLVCANMNWRYEIHIWMESVHIYFFLVSLFLSCVFSMVFGFVNSFKCVLRYKFYFMSFSEKCLHGNPEVQVGAGRGLHVGTEGPDQL